ncbi:MAG: lysylphosphatidylglycerol synthase transmembrane domain-containing protein [Candidatus Methylacidiphilales bacterium]|nr:lysylphosphatidylglycerol synthase transmembrane domain-containing protein [Candidatus Methylacidiphilales bacterium]
MNWALWGKILLTAGILGFVVWKNRTNGPAFLRELQDADKLWVGAAFVCVGLGIFGTSVRWNLLLRIQKIRMSFFESWRLGMVGTFFNNFLPGSTGGDVIRIFYALKHAPDRKPQAVLSVVMDRILGLIAILCVTMLLLPLGYKQIASNHDVQVTVWLLAVILALAVSGLLTLILVPLSVIPPFISRLWPRVPKREVVARLYEAVVSHGRSGKATAAALAVVPILLIGYCLARSLHLDIAIGPMTILFAIVLCAMSVPVSLSGHGIREGAFALLFKVFEVTRQGTPVGDETALACSTLFLGVGLVWSLAGGAIYLGWSHQAKKDPDLT